MKIKPILSSLFSILIISTACANEATDQADAFVSGDAPHKFEKSTTNFTVLDAAQYHQTVNQARIKIKEILTAKEKRRFKSANAKMAFITKRLLDIPFIFTGAFGEGDWGGTHIKQDPIYRLDGLNCQTFVQVAMALYLSKSLDEFDKNILKISYGAAGNTHDDAVHFYNRNIFIDGDWNPVNQRHGFLTDITSQGELSSLAKATHAEITRQNWFDLQQSDLHGTVRVLDAADGPAMANRFAKLYAHLNLPDFDSEDVAISYIAKEDIAKLQPDGNYKPNTTLLDKVQTPAVVEIIRDAKKWQLNGKNIKDTIGSELSVSHMGILYRKTFKRGEVIFQKTQCSYNDDQQKICEVKPVICQKQLCTELMMVHASSARPNGYFWYQTADNHFACSAKLAEGVTSHTTCNRVHELPLFNYLTDYQYGSYLYMTNPSILGVHFERLN